MQSGGRNTRPAAVQFLFLLANAIARLCYQEFQLRQRVDELTTVYNVTMLLADSRDLQQVLQRTVELVTEVMGAKASSLRLIDQENDDLFVKVGQLLAFPDHAIEIRGDDFRADVAIHNVADVHVMFQDAVFSGDAFLGHQRRVCRYAVKHAKRLRRFDLIEVCGIDKEFHGKVVLFLGVPPEIPKALKTFGIPAAGLSAVSFTASAALRPQKDAAAIPHAGQKYANDLRFSRFGNPKVTAGRNASSASFRTCARAVPV